jgi:hypothetical protein
MAMVSGSSISSPMVPRGEKRKSSLLQMAQSKPGSEVTKRTPLEERIVHEDLNFEEADTGSDAAVDLLDVTSQDLLNMDPATREAQHVDSIADLITKQAPDFSHPFSDEQIAEIAKTCVYHFFHEGSHVCAADEECELCAKRPPARTPHAASARGAVHAARRAIRRCALRRRQRTTHALVCAACTPRAATSLCSRAPCRSRSHRCVASSMRG